MNIIAISNIEQAKKHLQALPIEEQQKIFSLIDELVQKHRAKNQQQTMIDLIHQYPTPTSFNADDVVQMQRQWRDE